MSIFGSGKKSAPAAPVFQAAPARTGDEVAAASAAERARAAGAQGRNSTLLSVMVAGRPEAG